MRIRRYERVTRQARGRRTEEGLSDVVRQRFSPLSFRVTASRTCTQRRVLGRPQNTVPLAFGRVVRLVGLVGRGLV